MFDDGACACFFWRGSPPSCDGHMMGWATSVDEASHVGLRCKHPTLPSALAHKTTNARPTTVRQHIGVPDNAFMVMTACRLVRKKAVDFLIDSWPLICERIPNAHLVIVGGGQRDKHLRTMASQSCAAAQITFAGRISQDKVEAFYWAADGFVLASCEWVDPKTGLRDVETMGRVLCEANAAGLPVVAARSGGIPSVIKDGVNGLLFEPEDAEGLASSLERGRLPKARAINQMSIT